jgi:hypothetical protein
MHAEILPSEQSECLKTLGPAASALGFHLAGGTAIALHLGHRRWQSERYTAASPACE